MTGRVLVIAGSDSGGGAGVQADIKTINALGVYAASAITAITAQNTLGVQAVHAVPAAIVKAQIMSVLSDIGADVIKIGMLANGGIIKAVIEALNESNFDGPIVLDPVMIATSGDSLLDEDAEDLLFNLLVHATVITPNIPEAEELTGFRAHHEIITGLQGFCDAVFLKGGHAEGETLTDTLYMGDDSFEYSSKRIDTKDTHGTGCTIASAIAAFLALGDTLPKACEKAHVLVHQAILDAPKLGSGHGPIGHHKMMKP